MFIVVLFNSCKDKTIDPPIKIWPPDPEPYRTIDSEPDCSRVSDMIVFTHLPQDSSEMLNGFYQIWTMDLQTGERKFVTQGTNARWSPDGTLIAFQKGSRIWVRDMFTGIEKKIMNYAGYYPSWHPDGKRVTYDLTFNDSTSVDFIATTHIDSVGIVRRIGLGRNPCWSPDGKKILYYHYGSKIGFPEELYTMDSTGNTIVRLTENAFTDYQARFSFNGAQIVWTMAGDGDDPNNGIWIMNSDGSNQKQIIKKWGMPVFTRDGKKIIFYGAIDSLKISTLLIANVDGSNQKPLWLPTKVN